MFNIRDQSYSWANRKHQIITKYSNESPVKQSGL